MYNKDYLPREKIEIREKDQVPYSAEFVYRPCTVHSLNPYSVVGEKLEMAKRITQETQTIDLGLADEKSSSKSASKKHKKVSAKSNKPAMAKV